MTQQSNAKPGWYDGNYWDGQAWVPGAVKPPPRPDSPWGWILGGLLLSAGGLVAVWIGVDGDAALVALVGYLVLGFGGIMAMVGVVALGVMLGGQHLDYERQRR